VHVEVGLPNEEGRMQILKIHTAAMRDGGLLSPDVSLADLAARTKNYTGAEIEGLVRAAATQVYARHIDMSDLSKAADFSKAQVTVADFDSALADIKPAFGVREDELDRLFAGGIIPFGADFDRLESTLTKLVRQVTQSDRTPIVSVLLSGPAGTGKSALAAHIARKSGFPFIKRVSGESLISLHEQGKAEAVGRVFADAHKSPLSMVILDDIERIIEYVAVGNRFSNAVLQTLLVLVKTLPPPGRRLLIIGTTAIPELLEHMELLSAFQLALTTPALTDESHFTAVLKASGLLAAPDVDAVAKHLVRCKGIGIKKLLNMLEMARQDDDGHETDSVTFDRFMEVSLEWGL
jgi:vesicle-fusing ATPase